MNQSALSRRSRNADRQRSHAGFTLIELLVTAGVLAILASLLLPALATGKDRAHALTCVNNQRQLTQACLIYGSDFDEALPYNLGEAEIRRAVAQKRFLNWTSSVMSWELDADNTNAFRLTQGGIGPYVSGTAKVYRCPRDVAVSDIQAKAGWSGRVRSISMNAMVGNAGEFIKGGANVNNPEYRQFVKLGQIPEPSRIFVFIEEHPDSINDGYFLNSLESLEWRDLPASYHAGAANLSFADGRVATHAWLSGSTKPPAKPDAAHLPFQVQPAERMDFDWLMERTTVEAESLP